MKLATRAREWLGKELDLLPLTKYAESSAGWSVCKNEIQRVFVLYNGFVLQAVLKNNKLISHLTNAKCNGDVL